jgi:hypothetical protein
LLGSAIALSTFVALDAAATPDFAELPCWLALAAGSFVILTMRTLGS